MMPFLRQVFGCLHCPFAVLKCPLVATILQHTYVHQGKSPAEVLDDRLGRGPVHVRAHVLNRVHYVELSFRNLFWMFWLWSILGLVGETLVSYPIDGMWKARFGLIWGPFSPLYGLGAVVFTVALNRHWKKPVWQQFVIAGILGMCVEGFAGYFWKHAFGIVAWSYLDHPLNFWGYTSVPMGCVWGAAGVLWFRFGLPLTVQVLDVLETKLSKRMCVILTSMAIAYMSLNIVTTVVGFDCWFDRLQGEQPANSTEEYFAQRYDDEFMSSRFGALSMYPELSDRG